MAKLHDLYKQEVIKALTEKFGYKTIMQVPRIEKITLNMEARYGFANFGD